MKDIAQSKLANKIYDSEMHAHREDGILLMTVSLFLHRY